MWPLQDQIEYWENRTDADRFNDKYAAYSYCIEEFEKLSKVHPTFFLGKINKLGDVVKQLYESKTFPKDAVSILKTHGLY
jgi:hypothetical protein